MEKSVNDVIAEVIGRSDLRPRGRWILTKDTAAPPSKKVEENNETSILRAAAAAVVLAVGVALVAWRVAYGI